MTRSLVVLLAALPLSLPAAENLPPVGMPRLERTNLLVYRDVTGSVRPVKSPKDWERWN